VVFETWYLSLISLGAKKLSFSPIQKEKKEERRKGTKVQRYKGEKKQKV